MGVGSKKRRLDLTALAVVIVITAVAAVYRFWALSWGLPNALHQATYHPDEIFQVSAMLKLNPFAFSFDPGFYNYPSGYMSIGSIVLRLAQAYGVAFSSAAQVYLIARVVTAVMGVASIPIIYVAASRLFGKRAGYLSASVMAIIPLHIMHSHFATVDVPTTFWVALALVGSALILSGKGTMRYVFAGLMIGFAVSTKYNAALLVIPTLVAHFTSEGKERFRGRLTDRRLWMLLGCVILGFIIGTPGVLVQPAAYLQGFMAEAAHVKSGHGLVFVGKGPGWLDVLSNSLGYGMGVVMLLMSLLGFSLAVVRRKREDWILLSFVVPYFLMISLLEVRFARYAMPLLPVLAIMVGRMMDEVAGVLREQKVVVLRAVWGAVCVAVFAYTGIYSAGLDKLFSADDPRTQAADWFNNNAPTDSSVAMATIPWFYSPPLATGINGTTYRVDPAQVRAALDESRLHLLVNPARDWDKDILSAEKAEYAVVSDYESEDQLRVRGSAAMAYTHTLNESYSEAAKFGYRVRCLGFDFGPVSEYPHDMKYMSPSITIYKRK